MTRITVTGRGSQQAPAERASIVVSSRQQGPSQEAVMREVSAAHARVVAAVRAMEEAGGLERWHADRVWVSHHEEWAGDNQERRTVHVASASLHATFGDFDRLGAWIAELGTEPIHEITGMQWSLADETERRLGALARAAAVRNAAEKASDFAHAAGLAAPALVEILEHGAIRQGDGGARAEAVMLSRAGSAPALELAPSDVEVVASITALYDA